MNDFFEVEEFNLIDSYIKEFEDAYEKYLKENKDESFNAGYYQGYKNGIKACVRKIKEVKNGS